MTDRNGDNDNEGIMIRRMEMTAVNRVAVLVRFHGRQHAFPPPIIIIIIRMMMMTAAHPPPPLITYRGGPARPADRQVRTSPGQPRA